MDRRSLLALLTLLASGCAPASAIDETCEETGLCEPLELVEGDGKYDGSAARGPAIAAGASTEVWAVENAWADTTTANARRAGIAWSADSGLDWEQKFERWIASFTTEARASGEGQTFVMPTPYGERSFHAPTLECAETAIFLRVTFASWYHLPFYLTGWDSTSRQALYAGHFGFVNASGVRIGRFPLFRTAYRDHEREWRAGQAWPTDSTLRTYRLGTDDRVAFLSTASKEVGAGAYFDEIFLNKRVGYFMRLVLVYFGSINLADGSNTFHIQPEATSEGDILVHRWQKRGIGHVLPVFRVERLVEDAIAVTLASGSMPRREPLFESPDSGRHNFTSEDSGGPGTNYDGDEYAKLGGGIRRWRTAVLRSGRWRNEVLTADQAAFINDSDYAAIAARPARFDEILRNPSPEERRAIAIERIEAARVHLRAHPASCSARTRREDAFVDLYRVMESDGMDRGAVDASFRTLEDYVFSELVYQQSKTCCWNRTTTAMAEIVMDYAENEQRTAEAQGMCVAPTVFRSESNGYERWRAHAASLGRAAQWVAWSEDETCTQRGVAQDTVNTARGETAFCSLEAPSTPGTGASCDATGGGSQSSAAVLATGTPRMARLCDGEEDWYRVSASGNVRVRIQFTNANGDLDMEVLRADGTEIGSSTSVANEESVNASGSFLVRVYGYEGAANSYTISVM
jgi:hypothetical protein